MHAPDTCHTELKGAAKGGQRVVGFVALNIYFQGNLKEEENNAKDFLSGRL